MRISPLLATVGCVVVLSGCGTQHVGQLTGTASADPHQSAGRIPLDATVVTVTARLDVGPVAARERHADRPVTVTDPVEVARIAALIDGLPPFPPGAFSCPADFGGGIRLEFRGTGTGPVLALVTIDPAGCQQVSVVINGRDNLTLKGTEPLDSDILAIAGVHWPYPPGRPYSS